MPCTGVIITLNILYWRLKVREREKIFSSFICPSPVLDEAAQLRRTKANAVSGGGPYRSRALSAYCLLSQPRIHTCYPHALLRIAAPLRPLFFANTPLSVLRFPLTTPRTREPLRVGGRAGDSAATTPELLFTVGYTEGVFSIYLCLVRTADRHQSTSLIPLGPTPQNIYTHFIYSFLRFHSYFCRNRQYFIFAIFAITYFY